MLLCGVIWSIVKHETTQHIAVGTETGLVNLYQLDEVTQNLNLNYLHKRKFLLGCNTIFFSHIRM